MQLHSVQFGGLLMEILEYFLLHTTLLTAEVLFMYVGRF